MVEVICYHLHLVISFVEITNPKIVMSQLLQSISMTLSDMQRQLATIQEKNVHRDDTLRRLANKIKACKRPADQVEAP